jgi:hypothetical protein
MRIGNGVGIVVKEWFREGGGLMTRSGLGYVVGRIVAPATALAIALVALRTPGQQLEPQVQRRGAAALDAALSEPEAAPRQRLREGSPLTRQAGTFVHVGDRIGFRPADQEETLLVLENLTLERIWKTLDEAPERPWTVSGVVTEYRGRNYLLMERAVVRAHGDHDTPVAETAPVQ